MNPNEQPENEAAREPEEDTERQHAGRPGAGGVHEVPLFLKDSSDGQRGNAQDEKDEIGE